MTVHFNTAGGVLTSAMFTTISLTTVRSQSVTEGKEQIDMTTTAEPVTDFPRKQSANITFPTGPYQTQDYIDLPSNEPRVERRWYRYRSGAISQDLWWYGQCSYCENSVWAMPNRVASTYVGSNQSLAVVVDPDTGREFRFCARCAAEPTYLNSGKSAAIARGTYSGPMVWPEETIKKMMESPEYRRSIMLTDVPAVAPRVGAFIRPKDQDRLYRFERWASADTLVADGVEFKGEDVEALTPAHAGVAYERACGLPGSVAASCLVKVTGWRGNQPNVQTQTDSRVRTWNVNHVAALAPVLNPDTESKDEKIARLERERERLEYGLHARMVAEGVARSWCSEFDAILDATGLPPRVRRGRVRGTMTFETELNGEITEDLLNRIKNNWSNHIGYDKVRIETIEAVQNDTLPFLTSW